MAREKIDDSDAFITEVCWHYYVNSMTQADIARHMDVTRLRVNQAIQRAKSLGMVKVQIESPFLPRIELQEKLVATYGLDQAMVAPADPEHYDYNYPAGAALASFLQRRVETGDLRKIGVSWGITLQSAIANMPRQSHPDLEVISMFGGTVRGATFNSFAIVSGLAERLGASYSILAAPNFLSKGVDRDLFLSQEQFREHFDKFEQLDAAVLTCSDISAKSYLVQEGLPPEVSPQDLIDAGAVGDVVGIFLDRNGIAVPTPLSSRTIGISLETLLRVPLRVLVAAGPHKAEIIRAVLRQGIANTLITDDVTAEMLLEDSAP
ncbi:sugar-binding transcriptional regulator [Paracoccus xiamenensis]|uniref:sugar-binding transcriptional regulator n=1 Tax=Paracoccus xiamenensis TaxID=2714901 RepID=UPI00140D9C00|nr:sugar-binding transcriptional regulator [Paracoccus xiamenensis]NHF72348.1 sugar-binding transcriptional regulator [Paracoccus xiamenensis]